MDPRPFRDPLVVGSDHLLQIGIRQQSRRNVRPQRTDLRPHALLRLQPQTQTLTSLSLLARPGPESFSPTRTPKNKSPDKYGCHPERVFRLREGPLYFVVACSCRHSGVARISVFRRCLFLSSFWRSQNPCISSLPVLVVILSLSKEPDGCLFLACHSERSEESPYFVVALAFASEIGPGFSLGNLTARTMRGFSPWDMPLLLCALPQGAPVAFPALHPLLKLCKGAIPFHPSSTDNLQPTTCNCTKKYRAIYCASKFLPAVASFRTWRGWRDCVA